MKIVVLALLAALVAGWTAFDIEALRPVLRKRGGWSETADIR